MINVSSQENTYKYMLAMDEAKKHENKVERRLMERLAGLESDLWFDMRCYDETRETLAQSVKDGASINDINEGVEVLRKKGVMIDSGVEIIDLLKDILGGNEDG